VEEALQIYRDRVIAESGILYIGADSRITELSKYHFYVALCIATGHLYCKSATSAVHFGMDTTLARIFNLKKDHTAFEQLSKRQKLSTNDDNRFYAFIQKAKSTSERILCVFNFQTTEQQITVDMSGVNAVSYLDLANSQPIKYTKQLQLVLPSYGYRFYEIIQ
jgi:hypothetical protein